MVISLKQGWIRIPSSVIYVSMDKQLPRRNAYFEPVSTPKRLAAEPYSCSYPFLMTESAMILRTSAFSKEAMISFSAARTISRSQKRYHGFEPPKSHDFGGFSRVSSLFRNHEVCGYRVQKKRYHFKKTASDRMLNSFRFQRKRSTRF